MSGNSTLDPASGSVQSAASRHWSTQEILTLMLPGTLRSAQRRQLISKDLEIFLLVFENIWKLTNPHNIMLCHCSKQTTDQLKKWSLKLFTFCNLQSISMFRYNYLLHKRKWWNDIVSRIAVMRTGSGKLMNRVSSSKPKNSCNHNLGNYWIITESFRHNSPH